MPKTTRTRARKTVDTSPPATITVQNRIVTKHDGEESEVVLKDEYEELEVQRFEVEPAYVEVKAGVTKALRQYESLRIDVSMRLPCYTERVDATFEYASDWVSDRLYDEVDDYFKGEDGDGEED